MVGVCVCVSVCAVDVEIESDRMAYMILHLLLLLFVVATLVLPELGSALSWFRSIVRFWSSGNFLEVGNPAEWGDASESSGMHRGYDCAHVS